MSQYSNYEEYLKAIKKKIRLKHNREIDAVVKESIIDMICDCGAKEMKQVKRGTYIIECKTCKAKYKLID